MMHDHSGCCCFPETHSHELYHQPLCPTTTQADVLVPDDMDMLSLRQSELAAVLKCIQELCTVKDDEKVSSA